MLLKELNEDRRHMFVFVRLTLTKRMIDHEQLNVYDFLVVFLFVKKLSMFVFVYVVCLLIVLTNDSGT